MNNPVATSSRSPNRGNHPRASPRSPLQERTPSQTNEGFSRVELEPKHEPTQLNVFSTTPFPTKPQHVLLPSTVRKQRSFRDGENLFPGFRPGGQQGWSSRPSTSGQSDSGWDETRGRKEPVLQLKRSVTALRDMYEAQSEKSRPSTAASYLQRPGTAGSRLRSASSSEGFAGRNAWEQLHKVSADDMALLPSISRSSLERLQSDASFASRAAHATYLTSSPNYQIYGTSSPKSPAFGDMTSDLPNDYHQSSSSGMAQTSSSSPNFVRLGRSSSIVETLNTEPSSSSPNFIKLGTSSPGLRSTSSPTPSETSDRSRKRKRTDIDAETSFAARSRVFSSSPPYVVHAATSSEHSLRSPDSVMPSSPPHPSNVQLFGSSSPVFKFSGPGRLNSGSSSSSSTHASLQQALSSSPMPPIQYPVIRAPPVASSSLNVPKRIARSSSTLPEGQWISRLSPVPSEWDEGLSRHGSKRSYRIEELDEELPRSDSIIPESIGNDSQIRIIPISDDDHQHEATDELGALPRGIAYRSPPLVPVRGNSLFGTTSGSSGSHSQSKLDSLRTSLDTRLNSMKSFAHSRQNSFISGSLRPSSSGSQATSLIVPTWARRYYSGLYRDSFQYLYPSQTNSSAQLPIPMHNNSDRANSLASGVTQQRTSTMTSRNSRRSWQSIRNNLRRSIADYIPTIAIPKNRQRLEARKSHLTMGVGPLVSNPVEPGVVHNRVNPYRESSTVRRISEPMSPADPRAHWAGITDEQSSIIQHQGYRSYHNSQQAYQQSDESQSVYYDAVSAHILARSRYTEVPNLHHDVRLNTGSSISRGFGFPFNQRARHGAPDVYDTQPTWFHLDLRNAQVICFIVGFICPIAWFVGAFLPLPKRPDSYEDIEKAMYEEQAAQRGERSDLDIVARLQLERHAKGIEELKWQNARWWKRMNRWMCLVGLVVFVLIIVLAIIGTRNHW